MKTHPAFQARINKQLGKDAPAFWDDLTHHPPREGLRVNTLKLSGEDFRERSPFPLSLLPWTESGFLLGDLPNRPTLRSERFPEPPGKHPYHAAGLYYLQEPSTMAVAEILDPQPGERVLDLAAAPGGKSTHIASLMQNRGFLLANDPHKGRAQALARNLERWGATNTAITTETPERLVERFGPFFDRVLVDAPCSGEGMFRKSHREREQWTPNLVERCAAQQDDILWHAAQLVRPGGTLVYATCTFAPLEDEGTVARFLEKRPDFEVIPIPEGEGLTTGRPGWGDGNPDLAGTARLWPHLAPGEGHFIARLRRTGQPSPGRSPAQRWSPPPKQESQSLYREFFDQSLHGEYVPPIIRPGSSRLAQFGDRLYAIPTDDYEGVPTEQYRSVTNLRYPSKDGEGVLTEHLRGLSVLHWGWWLGTFKTKRFEPSHALAMGLKNGDARMNISLSLEDRDTIGYIRGMPFRNEGQPGWVLVTVEGYPLGWGKRVNNRVRSHSPRWLRGW